MRKFLHKIGVLLLILPLITWGFRIDNVHAENDYQEQIKETNRILDVIYSNGKLTTKELTTLKSNMNIVSKIPEENLNQETKELIKKYNNEKVQIRFAEENVKEKEEEAKALREAIQNPENSGQVKAKLNTELINKTNEINNAKDELEKIKNACKIGVEACSPYCKYKPIENCFLCPIFSTMFNTVNEITAKAITAYSNSVARVVIVAFGIWLALQILRFVSSIEVKDLKDLVQTIITQGFIVALVVIILETGVSNFFNTFLTPIYLTGQNAAQIVFTHTETSIAAEETARIREVKNGFSPEIGRSVIRTMTTIENDVNKYKALGVSMMCYSWERDARAWLLFPNFTYLITGIILWVFATVLIIALPFLMIDSVFQLGIVGALMPAAIGAAAFKYTRGKYTKPVWETFLNSMFAFVFISMVVLMLLGVLKQTLLYSTGDISQSIQEAVQNESAQQDGLGTVAGGMDGSLTNLTKAEGMPSFESVVAYTKKKEGRGSKKDGIYIDNNGFPTFGVGHLLFRADQDGSGSGGNHEKRFEAWYNEKIKGIMFVDIKTNKPATDKRVKSVFKKLYDSCAKRAGNKCAQGDENIVNKELKVTERTVDEALRQDITAHFKKTEKKCRGKTQVIDECTVWSSFNLGTAECRFNGDMCEKALTSRGLNRSYNGSATGPVSAAGAGRKVSSEEFELMFTNEGSSFTYFKDILESFHWASWHFIRLVFVFILAWSVMKMAKEFAGEMAKSISNTSIGSSIGTMAASSTKGMAVKMGKPLAQAAGRGADRAVRWAGRGTANAVAGAWTAGKIRRSQTKMKNSPDGKSYVDGKGFKHQMSEDGKTEVISRERVVGTQTQQTVVNGEICIRSVQRKENLKKYRSKEMTIETKEIVEVTQIKDKDGKVIGTPSTKVISVEEKVSFHSISPKDLVGRDGKANTKLLAQLVEGKSPEEKARIQRAVMKKINEQRFAKKYESKLQKAPELIYQNELPDGSIEMTYRLTTAKGEVVLQTMKIRASGFVESHQAITDKNGNVTIMSSDGIRNRMITAKLENAAALNNAKNFDEMFSLTMRNAKGSVEAYYSYTKHYQHMINHGADPRDLGFDENGNQLGMMGWEEAVGKNSAFNNFVNSKGNEFEKGKIATDIVV